MSKKRKASTEISSLSTRALKPLIRDEEPAEKLLNSFRTVCEFLADNPARLSWRGKNKPDFTSADGFSALAEKFLKGHRRSDFPKQPSTVPDEIVSLVLQVAYGYAVAKTDEMKAEHQNAMSAENCVGALLERYLDSVLDSSGWCWCAGDFVKAVDFVRKNQVGKWEALQVKNRDNSENSSSSAIRNGTTISKWFRSFAVKGGTNWDKFPVSVGEEELSEDEFIQFVKNYLASRRDENPK